MVSEEGRNAMCQTEEMQVGDSLVGSVQFYSDMGKFDDASLEGSEVAFDVSDAGRIDERAVAKPP